MKGYFQLRSKEFGRTKGKSASLEGKKKGREVCEMFCKEFLFDVEDILKRRFGVICE